MLSFFKKKYSILESEFLKGFTDIHSHILPGVDDGIKKKDDAFDTLNKLAELGVENIYLTPHIMRDYEDNNSDYLRQQFQNFTKEYVGSIDLRLAAEYMLDHNFSVHINNEEKGILTIADNHILIETSYLNPPLNFDEILKDIMGKGYMLILAHPERYLYMDWERYESLNKSKFLFFQLNLLSLIGYYGVKVQDNANKLLNKGFYTYIGSDIHNFDRHIKGYNLRAFTGKQISMLEELKNNNKELFL